MCFSLMKFVSSGSVYLESVKCFSGCFCGVLLVLGINKTEYKMRLDLFGKRFIITVVVIQFVSAFVSGQDVFNDFNVCGKTKDTEFIQKIHRIVGGVDANQGDLPW